MPHIEPHHAGKKDINDVCYCIDSLIETIAALTAMLSAKLDELIEATEPGPH